MKPLFLFLSFTIGYSCIICAEQSSATRENSSLLFTANKNQWSNWILQVADLNNSGKLILEKNKISFLQYEKISYRHPHTHSKTEHNYVQGHLLRIAFDNTNSDVRVQQTDVVGTFRNYYLGNDPARWASQVPMSKTVRYENFYDGVDMEIFGSGENLKYQFIVQPHALPTAITWHYEGVEKLQLSEGEIQYTSSVGTYRELAPYAYQIMDGKKREVRCRYQYDAARNKFSYHFLDRYNPTLPLIIDPTLIFVSYTGSTADNFGFTATYDNQGNLYAGGNVYQFNNDPSNPTLGAYPLVGAFQTSFQGGVEDIAISKFSPNGSNLLYSTYLGGNANERPASLVVNDAGELYVLGSSSSANFPTTAGSFATTKSDSIDIVIVKFNAAGNQLLASTFVGGNGSDGRNGFYDNGNVNDDILYYNYGDDVRGEIILDAQSNVYVASTTTSTNFPTRNAYQTTREGPRDAVIFKLNSNLSTLQFSTYVGGNGYDAAFSLKLDQDGNIVFTGATTSRNFPMEGGGANPNYFGGHTDGYLAKLSKTGNVLLSSTYIGTPARDQCYFVEIDKLNRVYVTGQSLGNYPVSAGVYSNPGSKQFIDVLDNNLSTSIRSTVYGNGTNKVSISPTAFLVDRCFNVYVAGWGGLVNERSDNTTGFTTGMPITNNAIQNITDGSDLYFIVLKQDLTGLLYGSYYGGIGTLQVNAEEHVDGGTCRFDKNGIIYSAVCAGCQTNGLFPTTMGVWSTTNNSGNCNLAGLKFDMNLAGTNVAITASPRTTGCVPLTVNFTSQVSNVQSYEWNFGDGATSTQANPIHTYTDTGRYVVRLVGYNPNTCNERDTAYIDVWVRNDSLTANFLPNLQVDCQQKKVTLSSTNFPTTSYLWHFGDGTTSTQKPTVVKTFNSAGTYNITLTVTDTNSCSLQKKFTAPVYIPPIVNTALQPSDTVGCIPLTVNFGNTTTGTSASQYFWDFGDGQTSSLKNPTHTYTQGGNYTVKLIWIDTLACNRSDTVVLHVRAIDSFADADFITVNQFFHCDSVRVQVRSNYEGEQWSIWNFGDGSPLATGNVVNHTYYAPTFDTITHILYDSTKICRQLDTSQVIISLSPLQTTVRVPDTIGCVPFTASLYGITPILTTHFYWFFPNGDSASGSPVQYTFSAVGTYRVLCVSIDSNACVNVDSNYATVVVIDDSTRANFDIQIINDCDSDLFIQLTNTSTNATHYSWNFGNGNTSTDINTSQHYYTPGTYTISLFAEDTTRCHPRDSITKTVTLKPNSIIDFDIADVCLGSVVSFMNKSNPLAQYVWQFGDGDSAHRYSTSHLYAQDGIYTVQLSMLDTSTCNVYDTLEKKVRVFAQPIADFSTAKDTYLFENPVIFLNESQHYNTSVWTFEDGFTTNDNSPTYAFGLTIGWNTVCLEVYNAGAPCRDTICDSVFIDFKALIDVPNAFSPNGDGVNDRVRVEGRGIVKLEFRIFNRWGQQVYYGTDQKEGWDGTFRGEPQEMEVYTYTVDAYLINRQYVPLKGNITLLR